MVSKTREKLIEVARQLFIKKGVENTTMNDIASASDKGRRTIYTYFKSKRDIFNAVIEKETDQLLLSLRAIISRDMPASEKLADYIDCRFETMREIVSRNGSLRAGFFRDVRKVDRVLKVISDKEVSMLREILADGVMKGEFEVADISRKAVILAHMLHGLDVSYIRDSLAMQGIDKRMMLHYLCELILNGIKKR